MIFDLIMAAAGSAGLPAPTFVGSAFAATALSASLSISKPTGVAEGDIMIAFLQHNTTATWTQPSGWTELVDTGTASISVAYKVAGASEGSSYAFSCTDTHERSGYILAYRGGSFDVIGSVSSATSLSSLTIPSVTSALDNSILLCMFAHTLSAISATAPSGMSTISSDSNATAPSSAIFSQVVQAGATGTRTVFSSSAGGRSGVLLSIKPA